MKYRQEIVLLESESYFFRTTLYLLGIQNDCVVIPTNPDEQDQVVEQNHSLSPYSTADGMSSAWLHDHVILVMLIIEKIIGRVT